MFPVEEEEAPADEGMDAEALEGLDQENIAELLEWVKQAMAGDIRKGVGKPLDVAPEAPAEEAAPAIPGVEPDEEEPTATGASPDKLKAVLAAMKTKG